MQSSRNHLWETKRTTMKHTLLTSAVFVAAMAVAAPGAVPDFPAEDKIFVERAGTTVYPQWLTGTEGVRDEIKSIMASEQGNLQCWIRVPKGAKGTVVVAVGEGYWSEAGKRIMDIRVDGQVRATGIDPIVAAGGKGRMAAIVCPAEDLDGDGLLHVQIVAAQGAPDKVTLAAGVWWLARTVKQAEADGLLTSNSSIKEDAFCPGNPDGLADLARTERLRAKLPTVIETENPQQDALISKLYNDCIFTKLYSPRPPALPHNWFSPGGCYVGQWLWDTMFVLTAFAPMDEDVALKEACENYWYTIDNNPEAPKGSYRYGMVPNFMVSWPPVGYSQIPILAWGIQSVYRQTNDRSLVERALPYLVAFDEWYSTERDVDNDGLVEYGAYKPLGGADMYQTAKFETFDLHATLDHMKLTKHPSRAEGGEWYGNVEGVEQTCFLLMSERAIVDMAKLVGDTVLAARFEKTIARRIKAMQEKMWDAEKGGFYSLDRDTDTKIPAKTIQTFLPLACGAATPEQAATIAQQLQDPKQWWTGCPVPTTAASDPTYQSGGFWRGDMWPPMTYLVAYGLCRYGYHDLARELTDKTLRLIAEKGINERYDSQTGQPLGVPGLGMSCSIWSMIVQNVYGVQDDFRTIRVPKDATGKKLRLGKLQVRYPEAGVVELSSAFEREFRVVFPGTGGSAKPTVTCGGNPLADGNVKLGGDGTAVFTATPGATYRVASNKGMN